MNNNTTGRPEIDMSQEEKHDLEQIETKDRVQTARISGMDEDLGLTVGNRVSIVLMVFFIGYIIFEIPSNAFIHKLGAANWLTFLAFAWGLVSLGIGFPNNWAGLAVLRSLLGVFKAGFFPGCVYLVSSWYKRYEVQKRMAGFFLTASALSAFANILAYGLIPNKATPHFWHHLLKPSLRVYAQKA
ncbi:tartrate transporter [Fusarium sp. NRRL 52700]|nr:tartrate transporter [Fusarium sp. NRRL 52700]